MDAQSERILEKYSYPLKGILLPGEVVEEVYNAVYQVHAPGESFADTFIGVIILTDSRFIFMDEAKTYREIYSYSEVQKINVVGSSAAKGGKIQIGLRDESSQVDISLMRGFSTESFLDILKEKSGVDMISFSDTEEPLSPEDAAKRIDVKKFVIACSLAILAFAALLFLLDLIL